MSSFPENRNSEEEPDLLSSEFNLPTWQIKICIVAASFVTPNLSEVFSPAQLLLEGQLFKRPIPPKGISLSLIIAIIVITIVIIL